MQPTMSDTPLFDDMAGARLWPLAPMASSANPSQATVTPAPVAASSAFPAPVAASAGPVRGIDVSRWQGSPDWAKVARAGVKFAYIKASEGDSPVYSTVDNQYRGAWGAGLVAGLYHYAKPNLSAEANADAFAQQVNRLGAVAGHLPPCLDLEEGTGHLSGWAKRFVDRLRARTGCRSVMVYSGASFFRDQIGESWMDDAIYLWIAHYGRPPGQPGYLSSRVSIHQYSASGQIDGIAGDVDLNQAIWPMSRLIVSASTPPTKTALAQDGDDDVPNLSVTQTLPAGEGVQLPILVPPYEGGKAILRIATGWTDAHIKAVYFIRDRGPNLTPTQEQWGGTGEFVLVRDDRPWWPLPEGTTQVSLEYSSAHPLGVMVTYKPATDL